MSTPGVGGVTGAASDSPHADLRLLDAVYEMAAAVAEASSLEDVYDEVLDALVHTVGADRAAVLLLDASGVLRCEASAGLPEVFRRAVEGLPPIGYTSNRIPLILEYGREYGSKTVIIFND